MIKKGIFVSLEGIDGCGKSTLLTKLIDHFAGSEIITIREPGGNYISEKIREVLLDAVNNNIFPKTEALLYAAARNQVVEEIIKPALQYNKIVLADRYQDSTVAYQGYGRGLNLEYIDSLNRLCTGGLQPDLTLLLDISPQVAVSRKLGTTPDRLESEGIEFQNRVRKGYLQLANLYPERIKIINAELDPETVLTQAITYLGKIINMQK